MVEPSEGHTPGALKSESVSTKQRRIAELAKRHPQRVFTSLNHYLDYQWLYEAYRRTRKDAAAGIDAVTAEQYARNLRENLEELLGLLKSGRYRAPSVRRVYISKEDGTQRPLGIPTLTSYCTSCNSVLERQTDFTTILDELQTHSNNSFSLWASSLIQ